MIERNIFVTKESIVQPIAYVENTNMIPIVLHIRDYNLPEGSVARAYAAMQSNTVILCEISGNDVIIPVVSGFFARGENTLQIRIVQGESRLLISFPIKVNVKRDITGSDASEPHDNPSVMDQLVAKYGEIEERLNSWDTKENTVTFESSDEETPDSWTDVEVLKTGEKHSSLFAKISTMFKNIRYIYTHFIKSEDILDTLEEIIANTEKGKVAGALAVKQLNSNLSSVSSDLDNVENICYNLKISSVGHDTTEYIIEHIEYNKTQNLLYVFFKNGQWLWIEIAGKNF